MKTLIPTLVITVLLTVSGIKTANAQETQDPQKPKIIAVLIHADWCQACQVLKPKLKEIKPAFEGQKILFTGFEMTNEFTKDQSRLLAGQLGLAKLYEEHAGKTGYMVLVDARTKEQLKILTYDMTEKQLAESIKSVIKPN